MTVMKLQPKNILASVFSSTDILNFGKVLGTILKRAGPRERNTQFSRVNQRTLGEMVKSRHHKAPSKRHSTSSPGLFP